MERGHAAEGAGVDEVGGFEPIARREHAVARGRCAASLDVAEDSDARLVARAVLDLARELSADSAENDVAELVGRTCLAGYGPFSPDA